MKKAEVETVKAYASRQVDIARPAYGHFPKKQKRALDRRLAPPSLSEDLQSQTGTKTHASLAHAGSEYIIDL